MKPPKIYSLFAVILLFAARINLLNGQVVINEFSASNLSQFVDNYNDYEDWIELYNTSGSPVNLTGYYLSDDPSTNTKWQIPAGITIAANGFLRFWASGRNEVAGAHYHTNFKLKQTKNIQEFVVLSESSGAIADYKELKKTQLGHSYGRTTNGANSWSVFTTPTFNASNNTSTPYTDYADKPDFSIGAGFYTSAQIIAITTTEPTASIHYTLNGTLPTASSPVYTTPLTISSTTVLKAITISTNPSIRPSFIRFDTYFINVSHTLPVVSISATQLNTLANGTDIRPHGSFEYFNTSGIRTARTYGEFNKHGQDSWVLSQRSLDFVSRDEMGYNHSIEEVLFNTSPRDNYQRIILRAAGDDNYPADHNSANLGSAHVRDAYVHNLSLSGGLHLDVRRGAKCIIYLNGQYWGVYDLRDDPDDHDNTDYYYGQHKYNLYMLKRWGSVWAEYGGTAAFNDWNALYSYIMNNNMAIPANYQYVTDRLDVKSLVDYVMVNMFTVCSDWLNWNTCWWRGTDSTGTHLKWGYMLWDNDATFGHYINYTGIPNTTPTALPCDPEGLDGSSDPDDHIGVLLKLRTNPDFNQYYISRQIDLWNTVFSCANMLPELDSTVNVIDPEMTQHAARWSGTYAEWQNNVQQLRNFIIQRCAALTNGFMNCYALTGPYDLTLNANPVAGGTIKLNSLHINQFPWSGTYFGGIENKLGAIPNSGYVFNQWTAMNNILTPSDTSDSVKVTLTSADVITAFFTYIVDVPESDNMSNPTLSAWPTIFSNETTINFYLPADLPVSMKLYSITGSEIVTIFDHKQNMHQGLYEMKINMRGTGLQSGIYFLDFIAGNYRQSIKLIYYPE